MQNHEPIIRLIETRDNPHVKKLVQETLAEFGISGEGFAGVDPELDDMCVAYGDDLSAYYVIEVEGKILGAGGYAPLEGTVRGTTAELRKMYFRPELRGLGLGQKMIEKCIKEATRLGFENIYLETVPKMKAAQGLYLKNGFAYLTSPMGNTGHTGCGVRMLRPLYE
ncbi:MAG: GNAT family N-acetyltransferase [Marinicella sp.]